MHLQGSSGILHNRRGYCRITTVYCRGVSLAAKEVGVERICKLEAPRVESKSGAIGPSQTIVASTTTSLIEGDSLDESVA